MSAVPAPQRPHGASLTPTESRLWDVLRGQPGRAFSRRELVARVMGGSVVLERTVDVHVKALRQKLGAAGRQIQTVRKVGYRLAPPQEPPS